MLGGNIIEMKGGHPTKGSCWFPAYNSTEGAMALEFFKRLGSVGFKASNDRFQERFRPEEICHYARRIMAAWTVCILYKTKI
jgi:hypothetical protein